MRPISTAFTALAVLFALVVAPATAFAHAIPPTSDPAPQVYSADFGNQIPEAALLPLTVHVLANTPNISFTLVGSDSQTGVHYPVSAPMSVHSTQAGNDRWMLDLTIQSVPALDVLYDICATGNLPTPACPGGFLESFYAFNPDFHRSLKVRSSGSTISAQAQFHIRAPSPAGFRISAAVQRFCHGSWKTLRRTSIGGPLLTDNNWVARIPVLKVKHTVPHLQQLLRQGARFRVAVDYRFTTGTGKSIEKDGFSRPVRAQG